MAAPGILEYKVIAFTGFTKDISTVIGHLNKEVTAKLSLGATLVGGVNIATMEQGGGLCNKSNSKPSSHNL